MDGAQQFRGCQAMMNFDEKEEDFFRNIVQKPEDLYSPELDPIWSEIISSCHQRDGTDTNGTNSSDHVLSPTARVLSFDNSAVNPIVTKHEEGSETLKRSSSKRSRLTAAQNLEARRQSKRRCSEEVEDHIMAERKRRQRITEKFIALSATIPGLKKVSICNLFL